MKIFFDTEFLEDGKTIELISIGLVREDGKTYYAENAEFDYSKLTPWLIENVKPGLKGGSFLKPKAQIADEIETFALKYPEFWSWYGSYDWVVLCQLFGTMMDLPSNFPMYVNDLRMFKAVESLPKLEGHKHNALDDAQWLKSVYESFVGRSLKLSELIK